MTTAECILTRRSIRKFQNTPVSHALFEKVIGLAAYAPSWKNAQITRYIAIEDKRKIAEIAQNYAAFNARVLETCPLLIAVTVIKKRSGYERDGSFSTDRGDGWQMFDCGIACQTLCLAAHEHGLGSVILGIFDRPALQAYLNLPDDRELAALVAIGYADEQPQPPRRKEVAELVQWL